MTLPSSPGYAPLTSRTHRLFPAPLTGYRINGKFSVCVPLGVDVTNGVANPSLELNTTGYSASGAATIARSTTRQRRGAYSLQITPTAGAFDGAFFGTVATVGGTVYTFPCDVWGAAGVDYRIYVASTAGAAISGYYQFKGIGRWQRVWIIYQENTAPGVATNRRLYLTKAGGASTIPFYWDGLAFTATAFPITYFDGDSRGFVPGQTDFYWTGTPHGSTSVMSGQTRAGGKLIPLANYGFTLLAALGLGMTPLANISIPLASGGGSFYQTTVELDRVFDLVGALTGRNLQELQRRRHDMIQAFKPDNVPSDQPLLLRYTPTDDCGNENGHDLDIVCSYESGLEGLLNNHYQENLDLRFRVYLPFMAREDGWSGATLGYQQSVANANSILQRTPSGLWQALGTGVSGASSVNVIVVGQDGTLYVGGGFTQMAGLANTIAIAKWNGSAWSALGTGGAASAAVYGGAIGPDGSLYVMGSFSSMGGVANTGHVAKWNGSVWQAMGTGASSFGYAIAVGLDGAVYAGGTFANMSGVANTSRIAKWNGSAWSALGTGGAGGDVICIAVGPDGSIYAGGSFTSMGGVANTPGIAKWNGSAWSAMGTGAAGGNVNSIAVGPDGTVYAGGVFTSMGGVSNTTGIAKWNGSAWSAMGTGVTGGTNPVYLDGLSFINGLLYIGGTLTSAGGLTPPSGLVVWNGSAYVYTDFIAPGALSAFPVTLDKSRNLIAGFNQNGTATAAVVTTITNTGVVRAYPRLTLTGTGTLYQLVNYTTGRVIYFNLVLQAGEVAVLDFADPQNVQFSSNFRPNLLSTILPGSNIDWFLMPGANSVSLFIAGAVNVNTAAVIAWRNTYHSIDSAINLSVVN